MIQLKLIFSIITILLTTGFAGAATLNVGNGQPYTTIQSALDSANPGDTLSVGEGTYLENLLVKEDGISIIGRNKEKTVIDGQKTGSVIRIETNNVVISGFTIRNSGGSGKEDGGITLYSANNNVIINNIITNNVAGVSIYSDSSNNTVSGNDIRSNGRNGIFIFSSNDNKLYNNNIESNRIGIYADSASTNQIYSNNFVNNNDQAYDNSGKNSWDFDDGGNYWSTLKDSSFFAIPGEGKARDDHPLSRATTIKYVPVPAPYTPTVVNTQTQKEEKDTGKSAPGFTVFAALVTLIALSIVRIRK